MKVMILKKKEQDGEPCGGICCIFIRGEVKFTRRKIDEKYRHVRP